MIILCPHLTSLSAILLKKGIFRFSAFKISHFDQVPRLNRTRKNKLFRSLNRFHPQSNTERKKNALYNVEMFTLESKSAYHSKTVLNLSHFSKRRFGFIVLKYLLLLAFGGPRSNIERRSGLDVIENYKEH